MAILVTEDITWWWADAIGKYFLKGAICWLEERSWYQDKQSASSWITPLLFWILNSYDCSCRAIGQAYVAAYLWHSASIGRNGQSPLLSLASYITPELFHSPNNIQTSLFRGDKVSFLRGQQPRSIWFEPGSFLQLKQLYRTQSVAACVSSKLNGLTRIKVVRTGSSVNFRSRASSACCWLGPNTNVTSYFVSMVSGSAMLVRFWMNLH